MPDTPLNPDAIEAAAKAVRQYEIDTDPRKDQTWYAPWDEADEFGIISEATKIEYREQAERIVSAYLAVAQPEVNTVEELDQLPLGTVILDGDPCVLQMVKKSSVVGSEWAIANEEHLYTTGKITLPARVLYRPTEEATDGR